LELRDETLRAVEAAFTLLVVISTNCTEKQGLGNRE
jgi:hypothetical protein